MKFTARQSQRPGEKEAILLLLRTKREGTAEVGVCPEAWWHEAGFGWYSTVGYEIILLGIAGERDHGKHVWILHFHESGLSHGTCRV